MPNKNIIKKIEKKSFDKKLKKQKKELNIFNNRYILEEEIGRGGTSIVYKASDIYCKYFKEDSNIVIKVPLDKFLKKDDIAAFVYSEYSFLKKLNHPNIVKALDFGIDKKSNIPYIVLENIEGILLNKYPIIKMGKKIKYNILKKLSQTIQYLHGNNIIHADINPSNILIKDNEPILFDFGISLYIDKSNILNLEYKKVKAFNPKYSAPEVLEGNTPTIASDIFSFSTIIYELFTNEDLFVNSSKEISNSKFFKKKLNKTPFILRFWLKKSLSLNEKHRNYPYKLLNY